MNNLGRFLQHSNAVSVVHGRPRWRDRLMRFSEWLAETWMRGWLVVLVLNILFIIWAVPQLRSTVDLVMQRCTP